MIRVRSFAACVLVFFVFAGFSVRAQKKFIVSKGEINFASIAELELIKATSKDLAGIFDPETGQFAFRVSIRSFQGFNSNLQREHFNENYLESEKFPTASFSGKIIEKIDFTVDGAYDVRAKGELEIHGQKQTRIVKSKMVVKDGTINIESFFMVPLSDHNISIPRIVSQKIATDIEVNIRTLMTTQR